ncbi:bifunctional 2',3'-cyclic-nucleotide 2'-phosphodiesterase/3'-nucleotidase [Sporosarcina oncorhynchi]|uniref:Bifunctional 2',3'-cyclic-nucleotide 2'-phosphodiesterase/3'-nucleotidase n=1 Tax=Sporosarcina oncorhynchi TaxID=3056444 RepID=A0ABZ0L889_9BACL|nr:bifunctional 2',3'-cyclic-nucleotide 2'-phosphodiesterase/3'-nucleotidase [Sporosarcina sp. T2O-4]WOV88293.1 bifunctional 2',3'-cyclic-nucleotide 2'-phosphodiesterase/3'-nucleotidase [Sporosarcina sp. T2O-4]
MSKLRTAGMWLAIVALAFSSFTMSTFANAKGAQDVTRGEYIIAVVEALAYELEDGSTTAFTDVDADLAPFVEAAERHGLVKGTTATLFNPNQPLSREHAFLIAARAVETDKAFPVSLLDRFKDKDQFKTAELEELAKSVGLDLFRGYENGTAKPQQIVSKGQVAKIVDRLLLVMNAPPVEEETDKDSIALRIMGTSDLHTNFVNYDYYQDKKSNEFGLAKTALLIDEARSENPNNLLFDNGDLIQGTPLGAYKVTVEPLKEGELHPAYAALQAVGVDVASLGNHEFNYGLDYLDLAMKEAKFPIINSTVYDVETGENRFEPYVILDRQFVDGNGKKHDVKVGVIGVVTTGIMGWDKGHLEGKVTAQDPVDAVNKFLPEVKEKGADIVVVISHSGIGDEEYTPNKENVTYQLSEIEGVDAIVTGHDHGVFPGKDYGHLKNVDLDQGTINGTPVVMPGKFGSHLGMIDLELIQKDGKWTVKNGKGYVREIDKKSDKVSEKVIEAVKEAHEGTIEYVRSPVGKTTSTITSYFSQVKDDPSIQIVTNAQKWYVENQVKGTKYESLPLLSSGAPFKAGGRNGANYYTEILEGEIAIKNVADLYVFDNTVNALVLTGADVKEWLEMSAGQFNQIDPASKEQQNLINEDYRTYNFDVIDGVTYDVDVTQPAKYDYEGKIVNKDASRIVNLQYDGKDIDPAQEFLVVTNNYRGSGSFPGVVKHTDKIEYAYENREAIMDYMIAEETIDPAADGNWKFVPIEGELNIVFESSAKAKDFIPKDSGIEFIGLTKDGFANYSLKLN